MHRFFALTAFFLALVLFSFSFSTCFFQRSKDNAAPTASSASAKEAVFLLVGVDQASYSSDVMMLVKLGEGSLSFLQIPRDSLTASGNRLNATFAAACNRVKNEGGSDKAAYAAGGRALAEKLSSALGIEVDAHATLTLTGLATLVDCIGGVDVSLDTPIVYENGEKTVTLSGDCHLDGEAAEGLVRCRRVYPDADYGRMRAQRKLIEAVFDKVRREFSPLALISLFRRAYSEVETDLAFKDALPLITLLFKSSTTLSFATLVGENYRYGKAEVEVLNENNLKKASEYLGGSFDPAACRAIFMPDREGALSLYESNSPPPFTVSRQEKE